MNKFFKNLSQKIQQGGVINACRRAVQLYHREGLVGIKRGLGFPVFDRKRYAEWISRYDTLTDETRAAMRESINGFSHKPLISVLIPTFNPKSEWLIEAIESVRKQIYPSWELCIADDASTDKSIRLILERYAREDERIKVVLRENNGHISAASNSALERVTGEWVALLDHDDVLAEHALFWAADTINRNVDLCLIYSDEDTIDEIGKRSNPYFKCDWNVDLFYSQNMICHLGLYRTTILRAIGGFRIGLEGSQDYDLALRFIERIEPKQIYHIPRVLYHWRTHADSTALSRDTKPYATVAAERALNEHFKRKNINAVAEHVGYNYRVRYALPDTLPMLSLIVLANNGVQQIRRFVESVVKKSTYENFEILIIDNGSDDPEMMSYFNALQSESRIRILQYSPSLNYAELNNVAVEMAQGELIGLVSSGIEVISPDWLSELVSHAVRSEIGAVGARLWFSNDTLQHGGIILGIGGVAGYAHRYLPQHRSGYQSRACLLQNFSAVSAACLVVRKAIYEEVGGLNEKDVSNGFAGVDFCLRVRAAGYRNLWTPYAELYLHELIIYGNEDPEQPTRFAKDAHYMQQRWGELLLKDPAYSPNLTLSIEDFSYAWPPRINAI
jgi:glycosyltransferase involved in cell wall biosynthesis